MRGLTFDQFNIGDVFSSQARTVTEADVVAFAGISGDFNPLHTDAEFGKTTPFGERIAHGLLGLSIATGLIMQLGVMDGTVIAFMGLEWKFKAAVKIGDTIHAVGKVKQTKAMKALGGGIVVVDLRVLNQRNETTQQGEMTVLIKSKT